MKTLASLWMALSVGVTLFAQSNDTIPLGMKTPRKGGSDTSLILPTNRAPGPTAPKKSGEASESKAEPGEMKPFIASIEAFGTQRLNETVIRDTLGSEFGEWLQKG